MNQVSQAPRSVEDRSGYMKAWRAANRPLQLAHRRTARLKKYGLTEESFQAMWEEQEGCCKICGIQMKQGAQGRAYDECVIDHDHETGQARGLLCRRCNVGIGNLDDNVDRLKAAVRYLENAITVGAAP